MAWKPGESGNLSGRPPESVSVRKARRLLERATPARAAQLLRLIDKAEEVGDFKAAISGLVVLMKKTLPDAVPSNAPAASAADPAKLAKDAERILAKFMAQHGLGDSPEPH